MTEREREIAEVLRAVPELCTDPPCSKTGCRAVYVPDYLIHVPDYAAMARAVVERVVPPCGTCGGVPPCSGLPCVCGGANTIYAERDGLRQEVYDRDARLARAADYLCHYEGGPDRCRGEHNRRDAQLARLVEALKAKGFHAPGECPHGFSHWIGDHCTFDEPALADAGAGKETI